MNNAIRSRPLDVSLSKAWHGFVGQRGKAFGVMIIGALLAFEVFNYSTTEFALNDVLGDLKFIGIKWATILAIAFCGIDFAGIARLFTPEQGADEPAEVWYLFGAWILAAAMNATLTWWGVSVAIATHTSQGVAVMSGENIQKVVPVFVAVMVWVIRILIIGTFSLAGERMFSHAETRTVRRPVSDAQQRPVHQNNQQVQRPYHPVTTTNNVQVRTPLAPASQFKPQVKQTYQSQPMRRPENTYTPPPEPTYHNLMTARELLEAQDERSK
jgi:hypothetical protein